MVAQTGTVEPRVTLSLGVITELTLARPAQANALDWQTSIEFGEALTRIADYAEVRLVVLRGAGRHFSSGGDFAFLEENTTLPEAQVSARMLQFYRAFLGLLVLPVPTLAVVQGSAIGAGLCLALACDLRLGSRDARLGLNFVRVGLHPGMGATALVPHAVGETRAAELLLTGEVLSGERGAAIGLLTRAVAPDELDARALSWAQEIASGAPLALRETVETLRTPLRSRLAAALPREAALQAANFGSADLKGALVAFRQRRTPVFVGR
jgi:enoyl-CoA hydratase/carnithine racemase